MSRCSCCDYSPFTSSEFRGSLSYDDTRTHKLYRDKRTGNYYCAPCYEDIRDTYVEMIENDGQGVD